MAASVLVCRPVPERFAASHGFGKYVLFKLQSATYRRREQNPGGESARKPNTPAYLLALVKPVHWLAQHASAGDLPNGRYTINPVNSGNVRRCRPISTADGANIAAGGLQRQQRAGVRSVDTGSGWRCLTNVNSGGRMDVAANAATMAQYPAAVERLTVESWRAAFSAKRVNGIEFVLTNKTSVQCRCRRWSARLMRQHPAMELAVMAAARQR